MPRYEKPISILSSEWFNTRAANVYDRAVDILLDILDDITESGYLPLEVPRSDDFNERATLEQLFAVENEAAELGFQRDAQEAIGTSGPVIG